MQVKVGKNEQICFPTPPPTPSSPKNQTKTKKPYMENAMEEIVWTRHLKDDW